MRLQDGDWLQQAQALPPGASVKVPHKGCSSSNSLSIAHTEDGFKCHCFKCHGAGFKPHDATSMTDYLNRKALFQAIEEAKLLKGHSLPVDFSHSLPERAQIWLASNGLKQSLWLTYNVGWSEKLQRVILPCYGTDACYIGYTARGLYKNQTKYIERIKHNEVSYFRRLRDGYAVTNRERVCIVEDWMSAAVIAQVCDCYPLLGTSASIKFLSELAHYKTVHIWLDPDKAGQYGRTKLFKELRLITDTKIQVSDKDPKMYSMKDIQRRLL